MIPLERVLAYLGIEEDDPLVDVAQDTAARVLAWVATQTSRHFGEPQEFVVRMNGGGRTLWLPEFPLDAESGPGIIVEQLSGDTWTEASEAAYELLEASSPSGPWALVRIDSSAWPSGRRNLRASFMAGYEPGELPGDIEQLVLAMTASWFRDRGKENLRSETIGGYSYTRWSPTMGADQLPTGWMDTITRWRHSVVA